MFRQGSSNVKLYPICIQSLDRVLVHAMGGPVAYLMTVLHCISMKYSVLSHSDMARKEGDCVVQVGLSVSV